MQMTKKFPSNDQAKLKIVCDELCDQIEDLMEYFELEYKNHGKMISMRCPIHNGDNAGALNLYIEGDNYRGNWKCRTHHCEQTFKSSIIGFIRGLLSQKKHNWSEEGDKTCTFQETIDFITSFIKKDLKDIKISKDIKNKNLFTHAIKHINHHTTINYDNALTRNKARSLLDIPAQYYIQRNVSANILDKYDVGLCSNHTKEMYQRIVVPVYDNDYKFVIGCSGRSIFEKCNNCKCYHDPKNMCPDTEKKYLYSKWKHSANFKSQNSLYNFWFAKKHIQETGIAIIVESPGNVWRLEENNLHNSVAMFGATLSDKQKMLLDCSGAMTLIILTDNDDAGHKAAVQIKEKCENTYRIFIPKISKKDVAEMSDEEINIEIKQYIRGIL